VKRSQATTTLTPTPLSWNIILLQVIASSKPTFLLVMTDLTLLLSSFDEFRNQEFNSCMHVQWVLSQPFKGKIKDSNSFLLSQIHSQINLILDVDLFWYCMWEKPPNSWTGNWLGVGKRSGFRTQQQKLRCWYCEARPSELGLALASVAAQLLHLFGPSVRLDRWLISCFLVAS
jgi:hypothetical protein